MNTAPTMENTAARDTARAHFFAQFSDAFGKRVTENRPLRLAVLSRITGHCVETVTGWSEEQYRWTARRLRSLAECPDQAQEIIREAAASLPQPEPPPVDYSPAEVARIEEGLRECNTVSIRVCWIYADLFRRGCNQARAAGHPPKIELTRLAKIARVKYKTAERWELLSRLVPEATRAEFPDLSTSAYEVAVQHWPAGHTPTPAEVRERLVLASDNGWEGPGLASHLLAGAKEPDGPHPSRTALEKLCAQVSNPAAAEVRSAWAIVDATVSFRHRKVAP